MAIGKEQIKEIINKAQTDEKFQAEFQKDPVKAVEGLVGVDLPEDQINSIIASIKAKGGIKEIAALADSDGDGKPDLGNIGKLGELFGKKTRAAVK